MNKQHKMILLLECCKHVVNGDFIRSMLRDIDKEPTEVSKKYWNDLIKLASAHGVYHQLFSGLSKYATDSIPEDLFDGLKQRNIEYVANEMRMAVELVRVLKLLDENNVKALAFKGPTLSQYLYGNLVSRQFGDLDILIAEENLERSIHILGKNGYCPYNDLSEVQLKAIKGISHDFTLINNNQNVLLELHWRLFSNEYLSDANKVNFTANSSFIEINGYACRSLATEELLLYLTIHGAKHQWERLEWLLDIATILENKKIDWDHLFSLMTQTKTEKIFLSTCLLCDYYFDTCLPSVVINKANSIHIDSLVKKLQRQFEHDFNDPLKKETNTKKISLAQFYLLPNAKSKILYIASLFQPTALDYQSVNLSEKYTYIYYLIRPYNVVKRWFSNIVGSKY